MMRYRTRRAGWLAVVVLAVMSGGCIEAVRDGFTDGLEAGISSWVQTSLERAVDDPDE